MTYTVTEVSQQVRSFSTQYGEMKGYRVNLTNGAGGDPLLNVELVRKAASPPPQPNEQLEGTIEDRGQYGKRLKVVSPARGGPSKDFKADPAKQAAIAMESAQKVAVDVLRLAMEQGVWKAPAERPVGEMAGVVKVVAASLFEQITEVAGKAA